MLRERRGMMDAELEERFVDQMGHSGSVTGKEGGEGGINLLFKCHGQRITDHFSNIFVTLQGHFLPIVLQQ